MAAHASFPSPARPPLRVAMQALHRHRGKAIAAFIGVFALVVVATMLWPRSYRSQAKLLLRLSRENARLDPTVTLGSDPAVAPPQSQEAELASLVEMMYSRSLLEDVADRIGTEAILKDVVRGGEEEVELSPLEQWTEEAKAHVGIAAAETKAALAQVNLAEPAGEREQAIIKLEKQISVESVKRSNVLKLSYFSKNPQLSQQVVTALIEGYLDLHGSLKSPTETYDFLETQAAATETELLEKQRLLKELRNEVGIASRDEQRKLLVQRVSKYEELYEEVVQEVAVANADIEAVQGQLDALDPTRQEAAEEGFSNEGTDAMRAQYFALKMQEKQLATRQMASHPELISIRAQIEEAGKLLDSESDTRTRTKTAVNPLYELGQSVLFQSNRTVATNQAREKKAAAQLAGARAVLRQFNEDEVLLAQAERDVELLDERYRGYSRSLDQARIDEAMALAKLSNVSVIQEPTFEEKPVDPKIALNLVIGLLAGLFAAAGLVGYSEYSDQSLRDPRDIEDKLQAPVIAVIPKVKQRRTG
jgi:succinoglycan biosynthesis transport protein ExoP